MTTTTTLLSLPNEVLLSIIEEVITPDQQKERRIDHDITHIFPEHQAILRTNHQLRDLGLPRYYACSELVINPDKFHRKHLKKLEKVGRGKTCTQLPIECTDEMTAMVRDLVGGPKVAYLKLDLKLQLPIQLTNRMHAVSWQVLDSEAIAASALTPEGRTLHELAFPYFELWEFTALKMRHLYEVYCHYVPCRITPRYEHIFCDVLRGTQEYLKAWPKRESPPVWYAVPNGPSQPPCDCAVKFIRVEMDKPWHRF